MMFTIKKKRKPMRIEYASDVIRIRCTLPKQCEWAFKSAPAMASHRAKCKVLRECSGHVRLALSADIDNLSFGLYAEGLIVQVVRDSKEPDRIVAALENRLGFDESAWELLIKVFLDFDGGAVVAKTMEDQLAAELSSEQAAPSGGPAPGSQPSSSAGERMCLFIPRPWRMKYHVGRLPRLIMPWLRECNKKLASHDTAALYSSYKIWVVDTSPVRPIHSYMYLGLVFGA